MSIAMDRAHIHAHMLEEKLRESACVGDIDSVEILLKKGVNVNASHAINGWTPLHWAVKRGHANIVGHLLLYGANVNLRTKDKRSVISLCNSPEVRRMLRYRVDEDLEQEMLSDSCLPITPHYLKHPPLGDHIDLQEVHLTTRGPEKVASVERMVPLTQELVLKVRIANSEDEDFIEVELPTESLSYAYLLRLCADELEVNPSHVTRIRKLPNTIVRKDKDVARLKDGQELELVLKNDNASHLVPISNCLLKRSTGDTLNGFQPISINKNQTILY